MSTAGDKLAAIAADIKLSHSIFAMPFALLATFMAAGGWPGFGTLGLIVVCMVLARTVAMSANRLLDARLDALNPRTARRAIPAGRVTVAFYLAVLITCAAGFVLAAAGFWWLYANPWPVILALPVLALISAYPLLKRFTRLCHYYLGMALGLAPLSAWIAVAGTVALEPLMMGAAVLCWTAGFDVLYACQDYQSDLETGIHSVPVRVGIPKALWIARGTHVVSWALLVVLLVISPLLSIVFAIGVGIAGALLIYEHSLVKATDLSKLNMAFFTMNGIISSVLGVCGIIDVLRAAA